MTVKGYSWHCKSHDSDNTVDVVRPNFTHTIHIHTIKHVFFLQSHSKFRKQEWFLQYNIYFPRYQAFFLFLNFKCLQCHVILQKSFKYADLVLKKPFLLLIHDMWFMNREFKRRAFTWNWFFCNNVEVFTVTLINFNVWNVVQPIIIKDRNPFYNSFQTISYKISTYIPLAIIQIHGCFLESQICLFKVF